jgi:hypothetical protein
VALLDDLQERVDGAQTSIAKTRHVVDVLGAIAMGLGVAWAIWHAFRRPESTKPSEGG